MSLRRTPSRYSKGATSAAAAASTSASSAGMVQDNPDPGFRSRIRQELMLARSNSGDRGLGGGGGGDTTGGESSEDEDGFRGGKKNENINDTKVAN